MPGAPSDPAKLVGRLREIVGNRHVLTGDRATARFRAGYRFGDGPALAVVRPSNLLEFWKTAQACVAADVIVIVQAANTGLTGGSTPDGDDYDRDIVIINTLRIKTIQPVSGGEEVICHAGSTLDALGEDDTPDGPRAAFGHRIVVHRRIGCGWDMQQLWRIAG